jgi:hypothetical protein
MLGDAFPERGMYFSDSTQRLPTFWSQVVKDLASSSSLGRGLAVGFGDIAFAGQLIQRNIDRSEAPFVPGGFRNLVADGNAERVALEPPDGQKDDLFTAGQELHRAPSFDFS